MGCSSLNGDTHPWSCCINRLKITSFLKSSWNPLRCSGASLPPNLLIIAKTIALVTLVKGNGRNDIQPVFLPFLPILDKLNPVLFQLCVKSAIVIACVGILMNCYVRLFCFVLAWALFAGILGNRITYSAATLFTSSVLIILALHATEQRKSFMNYQLAILYFSAGLDKLLQPGWRSGSFMQDWQGKLPESLLHKLVALFPEMTIAVVLSHCTIIAECLLFIFTLFRLLLPLTIWFGVMLHAMFSLMVGKTLGYFLFVMPTAYLGLVEWPTTKVNIIYDRRFMLSRCLAQIFTCLDFDRTFCWQSIKNEQVGKQKNSRWASSFQAAEVEKIYFGASAVRHILLRCPQVYLLWALIVIIITPNRKVYPLAGLGILIPLLLLCPFFYDRNSEKFD